MRISYEMPRAMVCMSRDTACAGPNRALPVPSTTMDKKKAGTLGIARDSGLLETSVDVELVEVAGVEPASEGA
jgi:hypothetical protein